MAYNFDEDKGLVVADTGEIKKDIQDEFKSSLGTDISLADNTPQGVIIGAETESRSAIMELCAKMSNQINPNYSGGIFLDAICSLMGYERAKGIRGIVNNVELKGTEGTVIPAGSRASMGITGEEFSLLEVVELRGGVGVGSFQAINEGKILVPKGSLNTIISNVLGWEDVSNLEDVTVGQDEETDEELRWRRIMTLGLQGVSTISAMYSGIFNINEVRSCNIIENYTGEEAVLQGVNVSGHTLAIYVEGGEENEIAEAIMSKHNPGCGLQGNISINIKEDISKRKYNIKFSRPEKIEIFCSIVCKNIATAPNKEASIRAAIIEYAQGLQEGEEGLTIGYSASAFEFAGAVNRKYPRIFVKECYIGEDRNNITKSTIDCNGNQIFSIANGNIEVIVDE